MCKEITELYKKRTAEDGETALYWPVIVIPTLGDVGLGLLGWPDLDLLSNSTYHRLRINMYKKRKNTTDRLGKGNVSLSGTHSSNMTDSTESQNWGTWSKSPLSQYSGTWSKSHLSQ